jgi:hypothetical protein
VQQDGDGFCMQDESTCNGSVVEDGCSMAGYSVRIANQPTFLCKHRADSSVSAAFPLMPTMKQAMLIVMKEMKALAPMTATIYLTMMTKSPPLRLAIAFYHSFHAKTLAV